MIDLARSIGTLSMALRNSLDTAAVKTVGVTRKDLMGATEVAVAAPPASAASSPAPATTAATASKPKAKPAAPKAVNGTAAPTASAAPAADAVEIIRGVQKANSNF
jgi:pilus assembly protein CpaB